MKDEPFVSVVICTRNRARALDELALDSISKLNYSNFEVVIIDDASADNTFAVVDNYKKKFKILKYARNKKQKSLCCVRNIGIKNSNGEIIAFVDDDCMVDKNWLKELVSPYLKDKKIMVTGGRIYLKKTNEVDNRKGEIWGCNMSFRKKIFDKFLFDEGLKYSFCHDEIDVIDRIISHGFKTFYNEKAIVWHFKFPALWKTRIHIGRKLNFIYSAAKNLNLIKYYNIIFITLVYGPRAKKILKMKNINRNEELINEIDGLRGILSVKYWKLWIKLPYVFFVLLFEIPIKSRIKHKIEEKLVKNG